MKIVFNSTQTSTMLFIEELFQDVMSVVEDNGNGDFPEYVVLEVDEAHVVMEELETTVKQFPDMLFGNIEDLQIIWIEYKGVVFFTPSQIEHAEHEEIELYGEALDIVQRYMEYADANTHGGDGV